MPMWCGASLVIALLLSVVWFGYRRASLAGDIADLPRTPNFDVVPGAFCRLATQRLGSLCGGLTIALRDGTSASPELPGPGIPIGTAATESVGQLPSVRRDDLIDAALVGLPAGGLLIVGATDVVHRSLLLDENLLDALTQLSDVQVDGLADFQNIQAVKSYELDSIKLRGTVGEQESAEGFLADGHDIAWPDGGGSEFGASNNPGWDFLVD